MDIGFTNIGDGVKYFTGLTNLTHLNLSLNSGLEDEHLQYLTSLRDLEKLNLANASITREGLKYIALLTNLKSLDISKIEICYPGFHYLSSTLN